MNRVVLRIGGTLCLAMAFFTFALRGFLTDRQVEKCRWIVAHPWFLDVACLVVGTVFTAASVSKRVNGNKHKVFLPLFCLGMYFVLCRGAASALMMRLVVVPSLNWQAVYHLYFVASLLLTGIGVALLLIARLPKFRNSF